MIDWSQVDTVLLDMDGTLLDLRFDNHFWVEYLPARYAERTGLDRDRAEQELFAHMRRLEGCIDWYCLDYWTRALQLDIRAMKRELAHLIGFRPQAEAFLSALGRAGKRRVLVTNAHRDSLAIKAARTGLENYLDQVISAHDFRLPKEDAAFWPALRERVDFDPQRSLLLDDNASVLRSARGYGIRHLLGIARPDSGREAKQWQEFTALESFEQLWPGLMG